MTSRPPLLLSRRRIIQSALAAGIGFPMPSFARAPGDARMVVVLLRGAMDGLAAVPPHGDPHYRQARGALALPTGRGPDAIIDLDGHFGLHPSLGPLHEAWRQGHLGIVHATALPYRARSHFDAQDLLENGTTTPHGARDGWLNRALQTIDDAPGAVSFGTQLPLSLQGRAPSVSMDAGHEETTSETLMVTIQALYSEDPVLGPALSAGMAVREGLDEPSMMASDDREGMNPKAARAHAALQLAGQVLAKDDGPRVAVVESGGWDTHANQGTTKGRLSRQLSTLAESLRGLQAGLGPAWNQTAVIVVSEFGRTVAPNGSRGTDHGTAGVALLLGGAIHGGRSFGDWPGLAPSDRHEGRDLASTTDVRAVFKGILRDHMGIERAALDSRVFPDSHSVAPLDGLIRQ